MDMNPWEEDAARYQDETSQGQAHDALIYPGLYSASSWDIMGILLQIYQRPNPQIQLGNLDASCPIIMCDLTQPDQPIVYASPAFLDMSGYTLPEVMGRNCRFLQAPGGKVRPRSTRKYVDKDIIRRMRKAVDRKTELQIEVVNFKKNGEQFLNLLSMIPVQVGSPDYNYCVGFQHDLRQD